MANLEASERQWCEYAVPNFLPALRASIVVSLAETHGLSQRQIAKKLGLTQAAVSHYTTKRRGSRATFRGHPELAKYGQKLAARIVGGLSGARLTAAICGVCTSFRQGAGIEPCFCIYAGVSKPGFLSTLGDGVGFPRQPCETFVVRRLLPFIRSNLARQMSDGRGQQAIASALGVSQPAVSHYIASQRGDDPLLASMPDLSRGLRKLRHKLEEGLGPQERKRAICELCVMARKRDIPEIR